MPTTDWIPAGAAVASVLVAFIIGVAAVLVARRSNGISKDAVRVAEEAREISRDAVNQVRRQGMLASVPHLVAERPVPNGTPPTRFVVRVRNGGPTVAYGILVSVAGAAARRLDAIDDKTRAWSGRQVALVPGGDPMSLGMAAKSHTYEWLNVRLEYHSPLGALVTHDYLGPADVRDRRYRLHRVTIDPQDGGPPIRFDLGLGPFDEEPDYMPPAQIW